MKPQKRFNPYHGHRQPRVVSMRLVMHYALAALMVGLFGLLLMLSPLWQLHTIEIHGAVPHSASTPAALALYFKNPTPTLFAKNNILFLNKTELQTTLIAAYGTDKIEIKKSLPHTLRVVVADPGASTVFVTRGKSYTLDVNGNIVGPTNHQAPDALIIYDTGATLGTTGAEAVPREFLQFLAALSRHNDFSGYTIQYALSPTKSDASSVTIATNKGFRILIDPTADIDEQLARMKRIIAQVVTPAKIASLDYIDLRFKEKVFYKTK